MSIAETMENQHHPFDPLYNLRDVSEFLNVKRSKLYTLLADGELSAVKFGRSTMICRSELQRYLSTARPAVFRKPTIH